MKPFNKYFESELLRADATEADALNLFTEALEYDLYSICVDGCYLPLAKSILEDKDVIIGTVIGFPLGTVTISTKAAELYEALEDGAQEIDAVINIGALKDGKDDYIFSEIKVLVGTCYRQNVAFGIMIEVGLLTEEEIIRACKIAKNVGVSLVSTSSGFSPDAATPEVIRLIRETVGDDIRVEASGGIETLEQAEALIAAGADKISTPNSVRIVREYFEREAYRQGL